MERTTRRRLGWSIVALGVLGGIGVKTGVIEPRSLKDETGALQVPFTVHKEVLEQKPAIDLPYADQAAAQSSVSQLKALYPDGRICPDRKDKSEVMLIGTGVTRKALCLNAVTLEAKQASGTAWIRAEALYPSDEGQVGVDLASTYADFSEACDNTVEALTNLLRNQIELVDPQAGETVQYRTQIVLNLGKASVCDEPGYLQPAVRAS